MNQTIRPQRVMTLPADFAAPFAQWVWLLEDTRRRTKDALVGLSAAVLDWTPPDGGNTIGTLLYHIFLIEISYLYEDMLEVTELPPELAPLVIYEDRDAAGRLMVVRGEALATHLERLEVGRGLLIDTLRTMTLAEFQRVRPVGSYDITPEWALHHLMQHEAEHRGEIMEIRRRAKAALEEQR